MNRFIEWLKLRRQLQHGHAIFLRKEYDRLGKRLRPLAAWYRNHLLQGRIIAVVGSLGKSTTRNALHLALDCPDRNFSYSNYGASLAHNLLRVRPRDVHAAIEVGINGPGTMARMAAMVRPNVAIVTSIASEHNRSFATLEDTREEKAHIVRQLDEKGVAILNADDPHVMWMATQTKARIVTFGNTEGCDVRLSPLEKNDLEGIAFSVQVEDQIIHVKSRLQGHHMAYPLTAALAAAWVEGVPLQEAAQRLEFLPPLTSRVELIRLDDGTILLDDCYKAATESILAALSTFEKLDAPRKIIVFGNVDEPVGSQREIYREIGTRMAEFADIIICVGGNSHKSIRVSAAEAGMPRSSIHLVGSKWEDAFELLESLRQPGDAILFKAGHSQQIRRLVLKLQGKSVSCHVKYCAVKVASCDICPLLVSSPASFQNGLVKRYLKTKEDAV